LVGVVAGRAVGRVETRRAEAACRVAYAGNVALVQGGTDDGVGAGARPVLAGVGLGAGVAIVAGGAIGLVGGRRADAGRGVARARVVALVRGADDGVGAGARPVLAG